MNLSGLAPEIVAALLGASLFIWAKPSASALNHWAAQQYVRFPKLKSLPGSAKAGTELNAKIAILWFRICGVFVCLVSLLSIAHTAFLLRH